MPFKSEKQRRYLHANHPEIAKKWEAEEKQKKRKDMKHAAKELYKRR